MKQVHTLTHGEETITITLAHGKRGFNVHVAHKEKAGKGTPKALIGCRKNFTDEAQARQAFTDLTDESVKRGWKLQQRATRNAFDSIPAPKTKAARKSA